MSVGFDGRHKSAVREWAAPGRGRAAGGVEQLEGGLDERGLRRAPQELVAEVVDARVGQGDAAVHLAGDDRVLVARDDEPVRAQRDAQPQALLPGGLDARLEADLPAVEVGRPADAGDVSAGDALEPDGWAARA